MLSFFFSSKCSLFHNGNLFGSCIIHILYTECAKIKKNNSGTKGLTLILLTWRIWWAPRNASKCQMGFNSAFKGLTSKFRIRIRARVWLLVCRIFVWFPSVSRQCSSSTNWRKVCDFMSHNFLSSNPFVLWKLHVMLILHFLCPLCRHKPAVQIQWYLG